MKTVGIIAEYNPFHNGHKYHIEEAKSLTGADTVIVIMSGNFVQRGEPALMNKWKRAESALNHGADLIIELPTYYALSSAEMFAFGSISLLDSLGVESLVFGSEYGSIDPFYKLADYLIAIEKNHIEKLQALMQDGHPFATARSLLMKKLFDLSKEEESILNSPNNILGVEYVKSIKLLSSPLKADTIKRKGSHYHSQDIKEEIASATAIRQFLIEKNHLKHGFLKDELTPINNQVPSKTMAFLSESVFINAENLYPQLRYRLMMSNPEDLEGIHDVREGLEHKILNSFGHVATYGDLISKCKSKRFTYTRLSRVLMKILLDIKNEAIGYAKDGIRPDYARILGFTEKGSSYLKHIRKKEDIQLVSNLKNYKKTSDHSSKMFQTDILATNLYSEVDPSITYGQDYYKQPITVKK